MLKAVGLSFAMGNADEVVKASATHVIGPNTEPGIAQAIYQYLL